MTSKKQTDRKSSSNATSTAIPGEVVIDGDKWSPARDGEWYCEHGVGHPGRIMIARLARMDQSKCSDDRKLSAASIHGCDGCCRKESFKKLMVLEAMREA